MTKIWIAILFLALGTPVKAEWITTNALPIPVEQQNTIDYINNYVLDNFDRTELYRDAGPPLRFAMGLFSVDAKRLADAGFPPPRLDPYIENSTGTYIPIYWNLGDAAGSEDAAMQYSCDLYFPRIEVFARYPQSSRSYVYLRYAWDEGGYTRSAAIELLAQNLIHELVHAIQSNTDDDWICRVLTKENPTNWAGESQANGIANYLLSKRNPRALRDFQWARDERNYSRSLAGNGNNIEYDSGSFFRFLIEATETNGVSDLAIARDLLTKVSLTDVANNRRVLDAYDTIVREHSGNRPLAMVFAEFLTELGSYSQRYRDGSSYWEDPANWIGTSFGQCEEVNLEPGVVETIALQVASNAGRCIKVTWNNIESKSAIQFKLFSPGVDSGSLHLGESFRQKTLSSGAEAFRYCYATTSRIDNRIAADAEQKCMLRRGAHGIGGVGSGQSGGGVGLNTSLGSTSGAVSSGAANSFNGWTTDFDVGGSGSATFILTNAALKMSSTQNAEIVLKISANKVTDETGASLKPRRETDQPVRDGRTLMDSRLHAIAGGPGRLFFDGRSVFRDGIDVGFLEGAPGAGEIDGGGAIVRAGEYMIMLVKDKQGVPDAAMIVRDPQTSGGRSITTLGTQGLGDIPSCGYAVPATIDFLTTSDDVLRFSVSGDLFDLSPATMMAVGQGGLCDALRAAHVEYKSIEVSLPFPEIYDGNIEITRAYPPMQDIYDELEFRSGPSFGGIDTSRSLVLGDGGVGDENAEDGADIGSSTAGGVSSAVQCACHCPNIVSPTTGACFNQCEPAFQMCPDPNSTDALNADASRYSGILQEQGLADAVRDMLLSDFSAMSVETRSQIIREALWN